MPPKKYEPKRMTNNDFGRSNPTNIANDLIGRVLVRRLDSKLYPLEIVETGAYEGGAKTGERYTHGTMHMRNDTLSIDTDIGDVVSFVTIRQAFPLSNLPSGEDPELIDGPEKLTEKLRIGKEFDGVSIENDALWIQGNGARDSDIIYIPADTKELQTCRGYYRLIQTKFPFGDSFLHYKR